MVSKVDSNGNFSVPAELFKGDFSGDGGDAWPSYGVAPDGRFLMMHDVEVPNQPEATQQINIIVNWFEELKRLVPVK